MWSIALCLLIIYCIIGVIISADDELFFKFIHNKNNIVLWVIKLIILLPAFLICKIVRGIEYIGALIRIIGGR